MHLLDEDGRMPKENWDSIVVDLPSNISVVSASDEAASEREVEAQGIARSV
jgi:hypothetical protein